MHDGGATQEAEARVKCAALKIVVHLVTGVVSVTVLALCRIPPPLSPSVT